MRRLDVSQPERWRLSASEEAGGGGPPERRARKERHPAGPWGKALISNSAFKQTPPMHNSCAAIMRRISFGSRNVRHEISSLKLLALGSGNKFNGGVKQSHGSSKWTFCFSFFFFYVIATFINEESGNNPMCVFLCTPWPRCNLNLTAATGTELPFNP